MASWFCALLFLFPPVKDPLAADLASRLETRYRNAKTLQATFLERYSENGSLLRSEAGTAYFRRPGRMRWEYERPEKDLFLVDGKIAWFYVPSDHTVTRVPARQSADLRTPLALLAGQMKISRVCARVELAAAEKPMREDNAVLRCIVRRQKSAAATSEDNAEAALGATESDAIFFEVARETAELARLIIRQAGGVEVEFRFENWRFDPALADEMFRFQPPAGVAIVNGDLASGKTQGNE